MSVDFCTFGYEQIVIGEGKIAIIACCGGFWSAICIGCGVFNH